MSYKDRYGITKIVDDKSDNLSVSWDYDSNKDDLTQRRPVFLYTPWMDNTDDHYHIELTRNQAIVLRDWLNDYLEETK
jgi:hypothetical protein